MNYFQYTHSFVVKVEHHTGRNEVWESNFNMFEDCVSRFPLNSFRNCEQYHLRVRQSIFSEASNDMHLCHIPLVVVLTSWMRWREFSFQMYRLLKKFIAEPYLFSND